MSNYHFEDTIFKYILDLYLKLILLEFMICLKFIGLVYYLNIWFGFR
jgi:hypothetical protein